VTLIVSRAYTYSNHVAWAWGKSLGLAKTEAKTFLSRPMPRLEVPRPRPRHPRLRPRPRPQGVLEAKARPRGQQDWQKVQLTLIGSPLHAFQ